VRYKVNIQKQANLGQFNSPFFHSNNVPCNSKTKSVRGRFGWLELLYSSRVPSHPELVDSNATGDDPSLMAAHMMRVQRTMGLEEGRREQVFSALKSIEGRRYGSLGGRWGVFVMVK
jgi:hypothetical protein